MLAFRGCLLRQVCFSCLKSTSIIFLTFWYQSDRINAPGSATKAHPYVVLHTRPGLDVPVFQMLRSDFVAEPGTPAPPAPPGALAAEALPPSSTYIVLQPLQVDVMQAVQIVHVFILRLNMSFIFRSPSMHLSFYDSRILCSLQGSSSTRSHSLPAPHPRIR